LAGVTRQTTIDIARDKGIAVEITPLQPYDVYTADEAFFTSTPYCIMPATQFNGLPVGDGKVGPLTRRLLEGWSELAGFDIVDKAVRNLQPPLRDELLAAR
jgi:branched-chain amino acid aminotransferase